MEKTATFLPQRRTPAAKRKLIEAGVRLFTRQAGQGLTARELAREANVNHALISYHFRGLSDLLESVVEHCIRDLRALFAPQLETFEARAREASPERMPDLLRDLVAELFAMLSGPEGTALLRAFGSPDAAGLRGAYGQFSEQVLQPMHHAFTVAAAKMRGIPELSLEAAVLGQCMNAQCMAFFRGARPVLSHLGKEALTEEDRAAVIDLVAGALIRTAGRDGC